MIAKFTFRARKLLGAVDSNMIANNAEYRNNIFSQIDAHADEELLMLSLDLRNRFGMLSDTSAKDSAADPAKEDASKANHRYKFGARG